MLWKLDVEADGEVGGGGGLSSVWIEGELSCVIGQKIERPVKKYFFLLICLSSIFSPFFSSRAVFRIIMSEFEKIMQKRRKSIDSGSIDPSIAEIERNLSPSKSPSTSSTANELKEKLERRKKLADASPDSKVVQDQLKKNEKTTQVGERNRRSSFSRSSPQLQQKLEKRLEKEKFAESVASFSEASNIEGITESEIDKSLSNKKNAVDFDAPSSELEGKLRKRRQSMAGIKMEDPKSTQKIKKKSTATTSSSSSLETATTAAAAAAAATTTTTTTTTTRSNATDTPTSQKSPPQKSPPLFLLAILLFFSLLAWFLFSKFSKRPDHHH